MFPLSGVYSGVCREIGETHERLRSTYATELLSTFDRDQKYEL